MDFRHGRIMFSGIAACVLLFSAAVKTKPHRMLLQSFFKAFWSFAIGRLSASAAHRGRRVVAVERELGMIQRGTKLDFV
jgi:hypothetical protein